MPPKKAGAKRRLQALIDGAKRRTTTYETESLAPARSPKPTELSSEARSNLKYWLDTRDGFPFSLSLQPASKKRKRTPAGLQPQTDIFEPRLDVLYEVRPREKWEMLRKFKKFTVGSESIATGDCILVKHDDPSDDAKIDVQAQWKAKVLEVRALDSEHVYIRIAWLNRPEDLPSGRKLYHGKNELIPTNQMDVIDAMAVNGSIEVDHWDEKDDDSAMVDDDKFFWRQTYDFAGSKTLSALRLICTDKAPQNPDEMILQCGNKDCGEWQHVKCIAEDAVQKAAGGTSKRQKKEDQKAITIDANSSALARAEKNLFAAEVFIKTLTLGDDERKVADVTEIVVTTPDGEEKRQPVRCLFCETKIE